MTLDILFLWVKNTLNGHDKTYFLFVLHDFIVDMKKYVKCTLPG